MKKSQLALALLGAFAGVASAQSTVTLYGVMDLGVRHIKNGNASVTQASSNSVNTSRLGVRGTEDLGSGLKASFNLEHGLNPDTGTQGDALRFWNRQSWLSVGGPFGEVKLGRTDTPSALSYLAYDPMLDIGTGAISNLRSSLTTPVDTNGRADNLISWLTPSNLGGFYAQLGIAPDEGVLGKKYRGGRVGYKAGPLEVSAAFAQTQVDAANNKYKLFGVGGSYDFGVAKLMGSATEFKYLERSERLYTLGVLVPAGPGVIRAAYHHADLSGGTAATATSDADDANMLALSYLYNLSKRTSLYVQGAQITNKGAQRFQVGAIPGSSMTPGAKSRGFEMGVRHFF